MKLIPKYKGGFKIVRKIVKKLSDLINKMEPTQIMVIGFAIIILIGAILLNMPISTQNGESIGFLDALFTSTSAVCVTGGGLFGAKKRKSREVCCRLSLSQVVFKPV